MPAARLAAELGAAFAQRASEGGRALGVEVVVAGRGGLYAISAAGRVAALNAVAAGGGATREVADALAAALEEGLEPEEALSRGLAAAGFGAEGDNG